REDWPNWSMALSPAHKLAQLSTAYGGHLPTYIDGSTPPPPVAPNVLLNFGSNSLREWKFHVDWATPANSTFTGPTNIPVAPFSRAGSVAQPGTRQTLDALSDRLMYRLAYRHFADGHEAWVVNHSVKVAGTTQKGGHPRARWYELRNPASGTMAGGTAMV